MISMSFQRSRRLKRVRWIVVTTIACDDCYFVSACSEGGGKIGEVLCRGDHIRIEALVEEENSQRLVNGGHT